WAACRPASDSRAASRRRHSGLRGGQFPSAGAPRPRSFSVAIELLAVLAQRLAGGSDEPVVRRDPGAKAAGRIVVMKAFFLGIECRNVGHDLFLDSMRRGPHRRTIAR